jgi:hypothetical protein
MLLTLLLLYSKLPLMLSESAMSTRWHVFALLQQLLPCQALLLLLPQLLHHLRLQYLQ